MINLYNQQERSTEAGEKFNAKNDAADMHVFKFGTDNTWVKSYQKSKN